MSLKLITSPAAEPVTLAEAKAHLRVVSTADDAYITALIVAARQGAEHLTQCALMPQTWELALDEFSDEIALQKPPFASMTSVRYVDAAGVLQTITEAGYSLDTHGDQAILRPAYGLTWPGTRRQPNAVLVRYVAGYANAASVPQEIKAWMLLRIGMLYENREAVTVGMTFSELPQVDRLLDGYRVWSK